MSSKEHLLLLKLSVGFQLKILPRDTKWFLEAKTVLEAPKLVISCLRSGSQESLKVSRPHY